MAPATKKAKSEDAVAVRTTKSGRVSKKPAEDSVEKKDTRPSATIKLRHIPYGFFEQELLGYFTQFGAVRSVRIPRSKKSGNDRGYAFVTFTDDDVARIAAEAMDGYLMFDKRLSVKVLRRWEVPAFCRDGAKTLARPHRFGAAVAFTRRAHKNTKTAEQKAKDEEQKIEAIRAKNAKLKEMGVDYELPLPKPTLRKAAANKVKETITLVDKEERSEKTAAGKDGKKRGRTEDVQEEIENDLKPSTTKKLPQIKAPKPKAVKKPRK